MSHLILGHISEANRVETMLRTLEVLLLSIDPTSGVLSLFIIGGLAAGRGALTAAYSRDNERQADDMGVEIAARACFDTMVGSEVMKKLHHLSTLESESTLSKAAAIYSSHPPSNERYDSLTAKASECNKNNHTHCHGVVRRMWASLWKTPRKEPTTPEVTS